MASSTTKLVRGTADYRDFVKRLSAEVFSRFGDYDKALPEMLDWPWIRTVVAEADGVRNCLPNTSQDLLHRQLLAQRGLGAVT